MSSVLPESGPFYGFKRIMFAAQLLVRNRGILVQNRVVIHRILLRKQLDLSHIFV